MVRESQHPESNRAPESQQSQRICIANWADSETAMYEFALGARITVVLDGRQIKVPHGSTILEAARQAHIRIPTLCYHEDLCIAGVCRICVVEIEGSRTLQAACSYPITQRLVVHTHSPKVRRARRHILELLLSQHYGECYTCRRNGNCELQSLAEEYGVDMLRFGHVDEPVFEIDRSSHAVVRDMNKCILCRRCVRTCIDLQEVGVLEAIHRGNRTQISTFMEKPLADVICINCGQCINRCPTAALRANDETDEVWAAIDDPRKHVVIQTAPSPRAAIGECFGLEPGHALTFEMNSALRACGFNRVFDTNFAADLTVIEEATELISRLYRSVVEHDDQALLPMFTSCSPGWVKFLEHFYPEMIPHLSSCKSPQQMFGALIKTHYAKKMNIAAEDIVCVALMPCSAKKFECNRPEMVSSGFKDIDYGLTTLELAKMIKEAGVDLLAMPRGEFDAPFGTATGSGVIFGATGGVMESALRCLLELVTGQKVESLYDHANILPVRGFDGVRYVELEIPNAVGEVPALISHVVPDWNWLAGTTLKLGVCHGTANAKRVLDGIKAGTLFAECHFVEFMACPGGCLGGGGQPVPTSPAIRAARANAIYNEDRAYSIRKSHENPAITELYAEFLVDGPGGRTSHNLLHTKYQPRGKYIA